MDYEAALKQAWRLAEKYSERSGYPLHPDPEQVTRLVEEMARNKAEFGAMYCPCMTKRLIGNKEVDAKRICPCVWHEEDIGEFGSCYCGLFVTPDFDLNKHKGVPQSVWGKYE